MRRGLTWLAGLVGIAALLRRRSRRRGATSQSAPAPTAPAADPVVELRQKLDDTRAADPSSEPASDEAAALSLDERRARVHERAQDAISLMDSPTHDLSGDDPSTDEGDSR